MPSPLAGHLPRVRAVEFDGDLAIAGSGNCACGRVLPTIRQVLGRTRAMFQRPDGTKIWPNVLSREFGRFLPHRQFRFIQKSPLTIELQYVPLAQDQEEDRSKVVDYARKRLFREVKIDFKPVAEIPRSKSGKYEDYVCEIT